tara:strand:- start:2991 stop:4610 length:1620 start_codon:yes stop_codon:yes gene_type:complete
MRINKAYFSDKAHYKYLDGLEKTGITIDRIPKIEDINVKLQNFGWSAVGVRGFLPPLIFMEFQSKRILPIACDMRSMNHIAYTPAPDIVHEAAGHSPMIADSDYADYLRYYGEISRRAISSSEDYGLYKAIRNLSDIKENPESTVVDIERSEDSLENALNSISYISEAAYLSRINWWTVEYGLVGNIDNPKIYGAGLLSSIGESENCLKDNIKKIPLSIDCINYSYDITEQQPQLFVSDNFKSLNKILDEFSSSMAYKVGGLSGINKAIESKAICTTELDSNIQISGKVVNKLNDNLDYLQFSGPVQICYNNKQINGHGTDRHPEGFGLPIGQLSNGVEIYKINAKKMLELGYEIGKNIVFEFKSGIKVEGVIKTIFEENECIKIITLEDCKVEYKNQILFSPDWGDYDMACGGSVISVFGGPADIDKYYQNSDNSVEVSNFNDSISKSNDNKRLNSIYDEIKSIRDRKEYNVNRLKELLEKLSSNYPNDWLAKLEIYEIIHKEDFLYAKELQKSILSNLNVDSDLLKAIKKSFQLIEQ